MGKLRHILECTHVDRWNRKCGKHERKRWSYTKVADMATANAGEVSTSALVFTLAAKATVDRAGNHTLEATWKFSSFTP